MSDNPTTGEWTVEASETSGWYIAFDKSNGAFIDNELTAKGIADAHNAALDAEREAYRRQAVSNHTAQDATRATIKYLQEQIAAAVEGLKEISDQAQGKAAPWSARIADAALAKIGGE